MSWWDENGFPPNTDGQNPGGNRPAPSTDANVASVAGGGKVAYTQQNPFPDAGKPVPNMPGFVYNWAGGMEPVDGTPNGPGETTNSSGVTTNTSTGSTNPGNPNYDGYAKPGYVPTGKGSAMSGWDATKWGNTDHQTPKYVVGKILSNYADTPEGLQQAMADIQRAYPGAKLANAKSGKITLPGVGTIDVG